VPPVTHTHALFAEESQSIPNNLVASASHILGPERAICGGDYFPSEPAKQTWVCASPEYSPNAE
jgi:hypothetical protein